MRDFSPPVESVTLYRGEVMHHRIRPKTHRFTYRVFSLLIDLGRLEEAERVSRLFSVGRFNLLSFFEKDHASRDGTSLDAFIRGLLSERGVDLSGGPIVLSCYPRVLGFVFNPLAVYFAWSQAGVLRALVYEVRNTFGETHLYVAPIKEEERTPAGIRQERNKTFYVSPFLPMNLHYAFRILPPDEALRIRILESDGEGPLLAATYSAQRLPMTGRTILRLCLALPLMTLKVLAAIHWEALRLWVKGIRIYRWTPPPPLVDKEKKKPEEDLEEGAVSG
jgi:uncharacterized protein